MKHPPLPTEFLENMIMNRYQIFCKNITKVALIACGILAPFVVSSCKEEIDDSNFAIKKEQTLADILDDDKNLSLARDLFKRVRLGRADGSSIYSVLSARGNYTVFVPDNVAVEAYLRKLKLNDINEMTDEQAQLVAYSCVIDNVEQSAYESTEFPERSAFNLSNFYDRLLTCEEIDDTVRRVKYDELTELPVMENGDTVYTYYPVYHKIDANSCVIIPDQEASNGMLHVVSEVIAPTTDNVPQVLKNSSNMKIMGLLLEKTGLSAHLVAERDKGYEEVEHAEKINIPGVGDASIPMKRYIAFTGFVEPDSIFHSKGVPALDLDEDGNILNADEVIAAVKQIPEIVTAYGAAGDDLTNPNNALYKFVQYHFIHGKLAPGKFVMHCNEYRYDYGADVKNPQTSSMPVDVWDYYTTIGETRHLLKVLQKGDAGEPGMEHPVYLNRFCTYEDGFYDKYDVASVLNEGVEVLEAQALSPCNGYVYPITDMLLFGDRERQIMGKERLRIDFTTILHELTSNNYRGGDYMHFPQISERETYFDNLVRVTTDTKISYLHVAYSKVGGSWKDYQGDEFMVTGLYDFTMKLPPVPVANEYEVRIYASHNTLRGMAQMYFGTDPDRLMPAGLPYDMRQSCSNNPAIPWVADIEDDVQTNIENDKNLRNQGYMKAPNMITTTGSKGLEPVRNTSPSTPGLRRIVTRQRMEPGTTYYLRYKSALKKLDAQLYVDFIEIVPKEVYNGAEVEDIW